MKKIGLALICILLLSCLLGSGCITPEPEVNRYLYSVDIKASHTGNYVVFVPIAYDSHNIESLNKVMSNLQITEGTADFESITTDYGPALKIESSGTFHIYAEISDKDQYIPMFLSMPSGESSQEIEQWIYCDSKEYMELEISIILTCEAGECCGEKRTEETEPMMQTITNSGWQKISVLSSIVP
jgi:hypothetical protein